MQVYKHEYQLISLVFYYFCEDHHTDTRCIFFSPPLREGVHCAEMAMVCLTDFEEYAKAHLSKATWDYYAAGADECCTRDDNLLAYKRYKGELKKPPKHL